MTRSSGRRPRLAGLVIGACCLSLVAGACSNDDANQNQGLKGKDIKKDLGTVVPASILDFKVQKENIEVSLDKAQKAYVDATVLYSVRNDEDVVQATIQISRFSEDADVESGRFRRRVVQQLGGSVPQTIRVGEQRVFQTQQAKSRIASWFKGRHLFVLSVREDFDQPRNLLRQSLELEP